MEIKWGDLSPAQRRVLENLRDASPHPQRGDGRVNHCLEQKGLIKPVLVNPNTTGFRIGTAGVYVMYVATDAGVKVIDDSRAEMNQAEVDAELATWTWKGKSA